MAFIVAFQKQPPVVSPSNGKMTPKLREIAWHCLSLTLYSFLPIACVVTGVIFKDQCRAEKNIPVFMIVLGIFAELYMLLSYSKNLASYCNDGLHYTLGFNRSCNIFIKNIKLLIFTFLFAWSIAGIVWITQIYPPEYIDKNSKNYCKLQLFDSCCASLIIVFFVLVYGIAAWSLQSENRS